MLSFSLSDFFVVSGNNEPSVGGMSGEGVASGRTNRLTAKVLLRVLHCIGSVYDALVDLSFWTSSLCLFMFL